MADKRHTAQLPIASYDHISKLLSRPAIQSHQSQSAHCLNTKQQTAQQRSPIGVRQKQGTSQLLSDGVWLTPKAVGNVCVPAQPRVDPFASQDVSNVHLLDLSTKQCGIIPDGLCPLLRKCNFFERLLPKRTGVPWCLQPPSPCVDQL